MTDEDNPYASPTNVDADTLLPVEHSWTEPERVRREYIRDETSIQAIGGLYFLGGILGVVFAIMAFVAISENGRPNLLVVVAKIFPIVCMPILAFVICYGLCRIRRWVKVPFGGVTILWLMICLSSAAWNHLPQGLISLIPAAFNGYFLYLVLGRPGKMIFSPYYAEVRSQTPHIKYRS